jgi:hypothetical protein
MQTICLAKLRAGSHPTALSHNMFCTTPLGVTNSRLLPKQPPTWSVASNVAAKGQAPRLAGWQDTARG